MTFSKGPAEKNDGPKKRERAANGRPQPPARWPRRSRSAENLAATAKRQRPRSPGSDGCAAIARPVIDGSRWTGHRPSATAATRSPGRDGQNTVLGGERHRRDRPGAPPAIARQQRPRPDRRAMIARPQRPGRGVTAARPPLRDRCGAIARPRRPGRGLGSRTPPTRPTGRPGRDRPTAIPPRSPPPAAATAWARSRMDREW